MKITRRIAAGAAALTMGLGIFAATATFPAPANAQYGGGGYNNGGGGYGGPRFPGGQGGYRSGGANSVRYRGVIDDRVNLFFRGDRVRDEILSGKGVGNEDYNPRFPLPRGPFHVDLANVQGRGRVFIFQQPNPDNGFTVGVRVSDRAPGGDYYSFRLVVD